jgi:hypothetical protein
MFQVGDKVRVTKNINFPNMFGGPVTVTTTDEGEVVAPQTGPYVQVLFVTNASTVPTDVLSWFQETELMLSHSLKYITLTLPDFGTPWIDWAGSKCECGSGNDAKGPGHSSWCKRYSKN